MGWCRGNGSASATTDAGSVYLHLSCEIVDVGLGRDDPTGHSFRSTFRTWCADETAFPRKVAEAALAHVNADRVEAAYQRSDLFDRRRQLMAEWAVHCGQCMVSRVDMPYIVDAMTYQKSSVPVPSQIAPLVAAINNRMSPKAVWLFGSRARGDHRQDSDWDLVVSLDDAASPDLLDPLTAWTLQRAAGVQATVLAFTTSELERCWGEVNTIGYDLARDGQLLSV